MSKRPHEDDEHEKDEEGPSEPKRMEVQELVVDVEHEKTPPTIQSPIVIQRQYSVEEMVTMLVNYLTVSVVTVRKDIHNFADFGSRVRVVGRSWKRIPGSDAELSREQWFTANRMSSLRPGTWQLERAFPVQWFFEFYHDFEHDEYSLNQSASMQPGLSGRSAPTSECLVPRSTNTDDGVQCMECLAVCNTWFASLVLEPIIDHYYILVYLSVGVYRSKWSLDHAKAAYSMKLAHMRENEPFALKICREHLRDTKIFMELNYLVWKLQAQPTIIFRIYAIARMIQEFADSPLNMRHQFDPFVAIGYVQFLQRILRPMFPSEDVEAFVNQL